MKRTIAMLVMTCCCSVASAQDKGFKPLKIPVSPAGDITVESPPEGAVNLIPNGDFEKANDTGDGPAHWQKPDNLVFHWETDADPKRGRYIGIDTDVKQSQAYAWWIKLFVKGAANKEAPAKEPTVEPKYDTIGGNDGGFYASELIPIKKGGAYKVYVDAKGPRAKVFVRGYDEKVALSFGDEQPAVQQLFRGPRGEPEYTKDGKPVRYRLRYAYQRWFAVGGSDDWKTYTHHDPCHPNGRELTEDVRWIRIQIYPYWPAAKYCFDNVRVIEVPPSKDHGKPESDAADVEEGKVVK